MSEEVAPEEAPTPKEPAFDVEVSITDTVAQEHEEFLKVKTLRKVRMFYSGKHDTPTIAMVTRLMEAYNIPSDASVTMDTNWDEVDDLTITVTGGNTPQRKRWFEVAFIYPVTLREIRVH